jgi:hypothetical protein
MLDTILTFPMPFEVEVRCDNVFSQHHDFSTRFSRLVARDVSHLQHIQAHEAEETTADQVLTVVPAML